MEWHSPYDESTRNGNLLIFQLASSDALHICLHILWLSVCLFTCVYVLLSLHNFVIFVCSCDLRAVILLNLQITQLLTVPRSCQRLRAALLLLLLLLFRRPAAPRGRGLIRHGVGAGQRQQAGDIDAGEPVWEQAREKAQQPATAATKRL